MTLLGIESLSVTIPTKAGLVHALREVSLRVEAGQVVGLVGESGGGKTMIARAIVAMLPHAAQVEGKVLFEGTDVLTMDSAQLDVHRGHGAAMCFQSPRQALNPMRTVRRQIMDRLKVHQGMSGAQASEASLDLLASVGLSDTSRVAKAYPYQLSGGMAQRVMVALCLACDPSLMLADEPTTGLDVTLTAETLGLLRSLADQTGRGVLLITHDIAAASLICDSIVVIHSGQIVEAGPTRRVIASPGNAYTDALLAAVPDVQRPVHRRSHSVDDSSSGQIAQVSNLVVRYKGRFGSSSHLAVDDVSLVVRRGETVGVVGESGSGKTTLGRSLLGLVKPTSGEVTVGGIDVGRSGGNSRRELARVAQMVFQDPIGSLDPRRTVLDAVSQPLVAQGMSAPERRTKVADVLARTGLDERFLDRRPHELSGGQAQRVGIARALVCNPGLIVFDEPTSALDVTVQAQILDLIRDLAAEGSRGQIFISHDLATVRSFCDRVVVMNRGQIVEEGSTDEVFGRPREDYTRKLLESAPRLDVTQEGASQ